ncbi:hypothetical protein GCM10027169_21410 [Gordonia jinhuaensis]|uniref:Amidohydrolase-related domain-containing protein n=1 Tax=Gordonia jinhuaensis TaxID=1517702 RepID=A0A916TGK7_9ACTN|nr:hypothetical protein GCM10011489_33340 [Gordonia jinhuaensis]
MWPKHLWRIIVLVVEKRFIDGAPESPTVYDNALLFPAHRDGDPFLGHLVVGDDGRFVSVEPGAFDAATASHPHRIVDLHGAVVLPGFVSAHTHLWQSPFRGVADGCSTMGWIEQLHKRIGPHFGDGDMAAFTAHGYRDMLRHGVTTVCNHTHDFGIGPEEQWAAAISAPVHTEFCFSPPLWRSPAERISELDKFVHLSAPDRDQVLGLSMNTTGRMTVEQMRDEVDMLRENSFRMHTHYLEDPGTTAEQQTWFDDLVESGRVGPDTIFAHFIHTTPHIRDGAARAGASMVWNPLSNGRLGSGIADVLGYRNAGVRVGMGVDGQASADVADPFENMRMGLYTLRATAQDATVLDAKTVLRMHTADAADVLGVGDRVGRLAPGYAADFLILDPPAPYEILDAADLWAYAVLSLSSADIREVHVAGRLAGTGPTDRDIELEADCRDRLSRIRSAL